MRILRSVNGLLRIWWPLFACGLATALVATVGVVTLVVVEERDDLRAQRDEVAAQTADIADLLELRRAEDATRSERIDDAVARVEQLTRDLLAAHDTNTATKLNGLLEQIAALLGRPTPSAAPAAAATSTMSAPASSSAAAPTPTTTPRQRNCTRRPAGPHC